MQDHKSDNVNSGLRLGQSIYTRTPTPYTHSAGIQSSKTRLLQGSISMHTFHESLYSVIAPAPIQVLQYTSTQPTRQPSKTKVTSLSTCLTDHVGLPFRQPTAYVYSIFSRRINKYRRQYLFLL